MVFCRANKVNDFIFINVKLIRKGGNVKVGKGGGVTTGRRK